MVFSGDRDRADEIAVVLQGALQDGEGFLVRCNNFSVEVVPFHENEPFELKHTHEELYGCLLSINEEISERSDHLIGAHPESCLCCSKDCNVCYPDPQEQPFRPKKDVKRPGLDGLD